MADHGNDDELEEVLDAAEPSPLDFLAYLIDRVREALRVVREALRVDRVRKALRRSRRARGASHRSSGR
jgi:hypothetical protein